MTDTRWHLIGALAVVVFAAMILVGPEPGGLAGATVDLVRAAWQLVF